MIVPIPNRIPKRAAGMFLLGMFVLQVLEGTKIEFVLFTSLYFILWRIAFNVAGGLDYGSGAYICFNGFLTVGLSVVLKALFFEPGHTNLLNPNSTMLCYCISMGGMGVSAWLVRELRPSSGLLGSFESLLDMKRAAIVCATLGIALAFVTGSSSGSLITAVRQVNHFSPMAIMFATTYQLRTSKGRESVNWIVVLAGLSIFVQGLLFFSKEGMLLGPTAWFIACALEKYDFPKRVIVGVACGVFFTVYYLVPYSQIARRYGTTTKTGNAIVALQYLSDLKQTRDLYNAEATEEQASEFDTHYFNERRPFLDRLLILSPDDALIAYTNKGHVFGLLPTYVDWVNIVPHFIWRNKPDPVGGNDYGRELGILNDEDTSTGISFSPASDAYHQAKWLGLLLAFSLEAFIAFLVIDSLTGSVKQGPWAMLFLLQASHLAAEDGAGGLIYLPTMGAVGLFALWWTSKVATPLIMDVLRRRKITTDMPTHELV